MESSRSSGLPKSKASADTNSVAFSATRTVLAVAALLVVPVLGAGAGLVLGAAVTALALLLAVVFVATFATGALAIFGAAATGGGITDRLLEAMVGLGTGAEAAAVVGYMDLLLVAMAF